MNQTHKHEFKVGKICRENLIPHMSRLFLYREVEEEVDKYVLGNLKKRFYVWMKLIKKKKVHII